MNVSTVVYVKSYVRQKQSLLIRKPEKNPLSSTKINVFNVSYVKNHVLKMQSKQYADPVPTENTI